MISAHTLIVAASNPASAAIAIALALIVLVLLGIWERIIRVRAVSWPMAQAVIDSNSVSNAGRMGRRWLAKLNYSFSVYEKGYTGRYSRRFPYEDEAQAWAKALEGKSITVHHSSRWPALNVLLDSDLDTLLKALPPAPHPSPTDAVIEPVPVWKKLLSYPFMTLALIGFAISFYAHIATWLGKSVLSQSQFMLMHLGIFVVFFPAIMLQSRDRKRSGFSMDEMAGSIGNLMLIVFVYALINFGWLMLRASLNHGNTDELHVLRGFSGHWMMFYFWSFGFLYKATHRQVKRVSPGASHM